MSRRPVRSGRTYVTLAHDDEHFEVVDAANGVVIRRIAVGPLRTNCYALHVPGSRAAVLVDPGGDAAKVLDAVGGLDIRVIVLTHAHWDHVEALAEVHVACRAPIAAHPDEHQVWRHEREHLHRHGSWDAGTATADLLGRGCSLHPSPGALLWDGTVHHVVADGDVLHVEGLTVDVVHTPGHTPGGICLSVAGHVLTGDTLFPGGPGLTGWPFSDFPTIIESIGRKLLRLAPETVVHPGHGEPTTIEREAPHLEEWRDRGW